MLRVARFLRCFSRFPRTAATEREITLEVNGEPIPASYIRPPGDDPFPGWILLHGITVPGRHHPVLRRFAHSLAESGAAVLIPEVPAWRRLTIDIATGDATIAAAAAHLEGRADARGKLNLVGFSFGATQALISSTTPGIREKVGSVVSFGAYCDLARTIGFMMTGEHEWEGVRRRLDPDPYGRWIAIANFLTDIPAYVRMSAVADAARELAEEAGRQGVYAGDPCYDEIKTRLRAALTAEEREIWDLVAAPSGMRPPAEPGRELARQLATAAVERHPDFDARPALGRIDRRVVLAHGFEDRLIPFTETLRLRSYLSPDIDASVSITRLFAHSSEAERLGLMRYPREIARYLVLLNRTLKPG